MSDEQLQALRTALVAGEDALLDRWMEAVVQRSWHLRSSPQQAVALKERAPTFLRALGQALQHSSTLSVGDPALREPVKALSFISGWLAGVGLPIGVGLALCHGLRATLPQGPEAFFDGLAVVVGEAYVTGIREKAAVEHQRVIRTSQVVCLLGERLAALFLVGDPNPVALGDAIGRLMMLAVMHDAAAVVLDMTGVLDADATVPTVVSSLAEHEAGLPSRRVLLSGIPQQVRAKVGDPPFDVEVFEELRQALATVDSSGAETGSYASCRALRRWLRQWKSTESW